MTLPNDFLAARAEILTIAADRVFNGSQTPIPVMAAYPGIYRPTPTDQMDPVLARMERARNAADAARSGRFTKRTAA